MAGILLACILFFASSCRIVQLERLLEPSRHLIQQKRMSMATLVLLLIFLAVTISQLLAYGDFGPEAQFAYIFNIVLF